MKILAFDSSGLVASVAILTEDTLLAEYTVNFKKTHSQTLLPMIDEIVKMTEQDLNEIDAIAVAAGPGSFTGLRIGSATAKGLGLALKKPLIPVPTVDALAYNLYGSDKIICPMMDAKRGQVYTGIYEWKAGELHTITEQKAVAADDIIAEVNQIGRPVIFLGCGVPANLEAIKEEVTVPYELAPCSVNRQKAASVGLLGMKLMKEGKICSARDHEPEYLRLSQAERERKEKLGE